MYSKYYLLFLPVVRIEPAPSGNFTLKLINQKPSYPAGQLRENFKDL